MTHQEQSASYSVCILPIEYPILIPSRTGDCLTITLQLSMSKPKTNLFYFDDDQDDAPTPPSAPSPPPAPVSIPNNSQEFSPATTFTKQFHKIDDTNQLTKNFFERDNNGEDRTKDLIITNNIKRKYSKNTKLAISSMATGNEWQEIELSPVPSPAKKIQPVERKTSEDEIEEKPQIQPRRQPGPDRIGLERAIESSEEEASQVAASEEIPHTVFQQTKRGESDQNESQQPDEEQKEEQGKQPKAQQFTRISPSEITNRKLFLTTRVEKGKVLECTLRRDNSGFNRFFPQYSLYTTDGVKYLMSSKKRSGNTTSNYLISLDKNDLTSKGDNYVGKLRSNWVGTEFIGYDSGYAPDKPEEGKQPRKEVCEIYYESNFFGSKGPRVLDIYLPKDPSFSKDKHSLKQIYEKKGDVIHLVNKPPRWNPNTKTFVLNFNNRVDKPSVKNFILVDKDSTQQGNGCYALLFGRVSDDVFHLDVKYPLSPLQAFNIVLSSFDYKLACE